MNLSFCWKIWWTEVMTSWPLFQNTFILRKPKVANFADVSKIATMFIKTALKDSNKLERIRNHLLKWIYICISWTKVTDFR